MEIIQKVQRDCKSSSLSVIAFSNQVLIALTRGKLGASKIPSLHEVAFGSKRKVHLVALDASH
jgi:hypothetical protein